MRTSHPDKLAEKEGIAEEKKRGCGEDGNNARLEMLAAITPRRRGGSHHKITFVCEQRVGV